VLDLVIHDDIEHYIFKLPLSIGFNVRFSSLMFNV
jgi:hypothetical protein